MWISRKEYERLVVENVKIKGLIAKMSEDRNFEGGTDGIFETVYFADNKPYEVKISVSKEEWESLKKRIADLEVQVRSQQEIVNTLSTINSRLIVVHCHSDIGGGGNLMNYTGGKG